MSRNDPRQSLAIHLFNLPLERLVDALEAIDDLDMLILQMHEDKGDTAAIEAWRKEVSRRRIGREQFLDFRLRVEANPCGSYPDQWQ